MLFNDLYRSYFEHQATHHPQLNHSPGKDKVFEVINVDEALGDFRTNTQEKGFIFRLIEYTYHISQNDNGDSLKFIQAGFVIAKYHSSRKGGKADYFEAMTESEKVGDETVEKMIADSQNGHPLFYYSLNTTQNVFVQPKIHVGDTGYSGWMYLFPFANKWRNCITHASAPAWKDGGQTPHIL